MNLTSPAFTNNHPIPIRYTCVGKNISPTLIVEDPPPHAQSFALIVHDSDTPTGNWIHWLVWNISPTTRRINEGSLPNQAIEGINDFGENRYQGPCSPSGTHHYHFTLFALDTQLEQDNQTGSSELNHAMQGHIISTSTLMGTFSAS